MEFSSKITCELRDTLGGSTVSTKTVRRRLGDMGFSCRVAIKKPLVNEKNRRKRLEFATKYGNWEYSDWENIIWTDESSFKLFRADGKLRVWRESKEKYLPECTAKTVKAFFDTFSSFSYLLWELWDKIGHCHLTKLHQNYN